MATRNEAAPQISRAPLSVLGIAGFVLSVLGLCYGPLAAVFVPLIGIALSLVGPVVCLIGSRSARASGRSSVWAARGLGVGVVGIVATCLVAAYILLA